MSFSVEAAAPPSYWQCRECSGLTIGIEPGAWELKAEAAITLPLAPLAAQAEIVAECGSCQSELAVEIFLRCKTDLCPDCTRTSRSLHNSSGQSAVPSQAVAKPAALTDLEVAFLSKMKSSAKSARPA